MKILESILDSIQIGIFWKDSDLKYIGCNQAFADDAGLKSPDEILGKSDFDLSWGESAHIYRRSDKEILSSGDPMIEVVEPVDHPDRGTMWVKTSKIPMKTRNGKIIGILGLTQNITEQKEKELEVYNRENYYRSIFEEAPTAIVEEDFSEVKAYIKKLQAKGITNMDEYLSENPKHILNCISLIKPVNVNQRAIRLFNAPDKDTLLKTLIERRKSGKVNPTSLGVLKKSILKALKGEFDFDLREINRKLTGEDFPVLVQTTVPPLYRNSWKKTIHTLIDLSHKPAQEDYPHIIPICSSCKQIRDEEGGWVEIEGYMSSLCECGFTHGLCPDCVRKLYEDFF